VLANQAANGGAFYAAGGARVECDGVDFGQAGSGNTATAGSGGAVYLSGSTLQADNCQFGHNQALAGDGGAIAAFTSTVELDADFAAAGLTAPAAADRLDDISAPLATGCNPLVQQCSRLTSNRAYSSTVANGNGGALYAADSRLSVNTTYVQGNTAARGGALYQTGASATAWISNTVVYSNTSLVGLGAGIRNAAGGLTITHGTLANNLGGAGLSTGSALSYVYNTLIWGNSVAAFGALAAAVCSFDQGGTAGPAVDPEFVAPGGGEDYHLGLNSPAADACSTGLPSDVDNRPRPFGANFDIGAYELIVTRLFVPLVRR
jgi:hypothetical protein